MTMTYSVQMFIFKASRISTSLTSSIRNEHIKKTASNFRLNIKIHARSCGCIPTHLCIAYNFNHCHKWFKLHLHFFIVVIMFVAVHLATKRILLFLLPFHVQCSFTVLMQIYAFICNAVYCLSDECIPSWKYFVDYAQPKSAGIGTCLYFLPFLWNWKCNN